jgi:dihydrodipicolinate synthase/N-acetylneuraminate lyase
MLIREAITKLEGFLSGPDEALLSMLVGLEGWSPNAREEMLDFLKRVLSALRDETQLSEGEYEEMLNRLMSLHDRLKSTYKDVEEKMLARYRSRVVL